MEKSLVGRQPIYREGVQVCGYELFSSKDELKLAPLATDPVAANALLNDFIDIGIEQVAGPDPGFVSVTHEFLLSDYRSSLPKNSVVLQVPAATPANNDVLNSICGLVAEGYSIALNHFVYNDELRPMIEAAEIVKLSVRDHDRFALAEQVHKLGPFDIRLLAEHVETESEYLYCKDLGFDYFEGYFFSKPRFSNKTALPANRLSTLHLLSKLQEPDISLDELEYAVGQDVAMSYRILRYLNSATLALPRQIDSIRHAVMMVGTNLIRNWASVLLLESIEDKPRELMVMAMVRAYMCKQLGAAMGAKNLDQFFTVGLFSLLDTLLDRPMPMVLDDLPLIDPVKNALLNRAGLMGAALKCVEAYERCDWDQASCMNLDPKKIREAYLNAVAWSRAVTRELVN
jgi:EAL and modified HD-GYP domain-containing signal transduction protein